MIRRALISLALALYVATAGGTVHVNDGGTWRTITNVYVNDSGTWREIKWVYVNDGGTWRLVFKLPLEASVSGSPAVGACLSDTSCTATTTAVTITADKGTGDYTYSWTHVSGDTFTVNSPTSATTTFSKTSSTPTAFVGVYRGAVNDGVEEKTFDVTVQTSHNCITC